MESLLGGIITQYQLINKEDNAKVVRAVRLHGHCLGISVSQTLKWSLSVLVNYLHFLTNARVGGYCLFLLLKREVTTKEGKFTQE